MKLMNLLENPYKNGERNFIFDIIDGHLQSYRSSSSGLYVDSNGDIFDIWANHKGNVRAREQRVG